MTKTFGNNKRHAQNYYNIVCKNKKIDFAFIALGKGGWIVTYNYKK